MEKSQPSLSKQTRKPRKRAREFIEDGKSRRKTFMKRVPTLKKKAEELAELCGIPVCVVCFGPDGTVDVWPEDRTKAEAVIMKYMERSSDCMQKLYLSGMLETMDKKEKQQPWHFLDNQLMHKLSPEELQILMRNLDSKILTAEERIRFLKGKSVQNLELGAEELSPLSIELPEFNDLYGIKNSNMKHEERSGFPGFDDVYHPSLALVPVAHYSSYMAMLTASDDQTDFTIPSTDNSRRLGDYSWPSGGILETNLGNSFLSGQAGVWPPTPLHEALPITAVWPRQSLQSSQMNHYGDTDGS
ncbi:hypothetical protein FH972_007171 [Carpinus fangiana]|uniref:MADS-box domain-containing protein n=1 Tax=Carpinus fangiana TaxID=176857 RepID=A0A5N6QY31_9ROSI|nr:hypothetical protein FH972_007171 [Carpinus fangiana]